jgi:hypothetical protein
VRDDVVQLGRDAGALVADGERGEGLALALELVRALGEAPGHEIARADRPAGDPRRCHDEDVGDHRAGDLVADTVQLQRDRAARDRVQAVVLAYETGLVTPELPA